MTGTPFDIVMLVLVICAYFAPLVIAAVRETRNAFKIGLLNLLLGWTAVGWLGALIWAILDQKADATYRQAPGS